MQERVLEAIKLYEVKCSGKDVDYVITEEIEDESEGAALYLFESEKDGIKSAAFAYESGEVFVLTDWQGSRPEKLSEVADYDWLTISGHDAINLNGYPRKFCETSKIYEYEKGYYVFAPCRDNGKYERSVYILQ